MEVYKWAKQLRKKFPTLLPTRVYVRDLSKDNDLGKTDLILIDGKPHHFNITIHKSFNFVMFDALLHEWAHVYSWQEGEVVERHNIEWGIVFSKIYREMKNED